MGRRRKPTALERKMALRLKELRRQRGLTQYELAETCGVTVDAIRKWEQARRTMGTEAALKIAAGLKISLDELFGRKPPRRRRPEEE